jgi:ACS family tartrate transporter-like MFS transporter
MEPPDAISLAPASAAAPDPRAVLRKVTRRLVPFLCLLYVCNLLDRSNVGFARLTMQPDLGLDPAVFDLCYGIFYLGYLLFEVPSNLLLRRTGARRWVARIMISWGLVSCLTMAVTGPWSFFAVRILLGVAEAGFFPGIVFYLTWWFPARERARVLALFMAAGPVNGIISNPLSGAILQYLQGVAGLEGWQWLFLLEGIPSVLLGFAILFYLTDSPEQARWLTPAERSWLVGCLRDEERYRQLRHGTGLLRALVDPRVWLLICVYFTVAVGSNASGSYLPQLIRDRFPAQSKLVIGLLGSIPHASAVVGMTVLGALSDRGGERRVYLAFAALLAAAGWGITALATDPWLGLAGLCLAQTGMMSMLPLFWPLPASFLSGAAAAGGIALINSVANLGGLMGANILGRFGLWSMAGILLGGAALALCVRHDPTLDRGLPAEKPAE